MPPTKYTYDMYGNEQTQVDALGRTTSFFYDPQGRQIQEALPYVGVINVNTTTYSGQGQLYMTKDVNGYSTTYSYDTLGRVSVISYTSGNGSELVGYTYDDLGRAHTTLDASGTTTDTYDSDGNLIEQQTPEGNIYYAYNALDQHTETYTGTAADKITDIVYGYDIEGRLTTTTVERINDATVNLVTTDNYDAAGNKAEEILPNGVTTTYYYDGLNRLEKLSTVNASNQVILSQKFALNADGSRKSVHEIELQPDGSTVTSDTAWTYDAINRLTSETLTTTASSSNYTDVFTYDLVANRLTSAHTGPGGGANETITYTYSAQDQLTSQVSSLHGTTTNTYDRDGSLVSSVTGGQTTTYGYDPREKMTSAHVNGVTTTYIYDDAGNRVQETTGGVTTLYLTDTNNPTGYAEPIEQRATAASMPSMTYVLGDRVLAQQAGSASIASYLVVDGHGSTRALLSSTSAATNSFNYTAYGTALNFTATSAPTLFLFGGDAIFDSPTGFYLHGDGTRPTNGFWFTQMDGRGHGMDTDAITLHKYLLDGANPIKNWDRNGHEGEEVLEATSLGGWLDSTFSFGVRVASRIATPLLGLLSSGAAWLVTQGQGALEFLRSQGTSGITYLQQAFLQQEDVISEEEAEAGPIWNNFTAAKDYLNKLLTGSANNPEGIQWHHLVNQASGFAARLVNSAANLVPTPTPIHAEISRFIGSGAEWLPEYSRVQDFIVTLDWQEQYEVGLRIWQSAMYGELQEQGREIVEKFMH